MEELTFLDGAGFGEVGCPGDPSTGRMAVLEVADAVEHQISVRSAVPVSLTLQTIEEGMCSPKVPCRASAPAPGGEEQVSLSEVLQPGRYQIIVTTTATVTEEQTVELTLTR